MREPVARLIRKVVLIYPIPLRYSGFLSAQRMPGLVMTHAGLTILAQVLEGAGVEVTVYDEQITRYRDALVLGADLVGLTVQTCGANRAYWIADRVRALGIPVVLGGFHATLAAEEAIGHADYVVRGEGERTLAELVSALRAGRPLDPILGLSWWQGGQARHNPPRPQMTTRELDRVPWPRYDRVAGLDRPLRYPLNRRIHFTLLTRGCNRSCTFCTITPHMGHALRHRSIASILEELGSRWDPRRQFLFLLDDSLAAEPEFLKELLEALLRERLVPELGWQSQMRADAASDPELLRLMKETRCAFVSCGFESIDDRSLKRLGKGQSARDVRRAVARFREQGILVNGYFVFGTDEDGPEAMRSTVRFALSAGITLGGFMPLTPFPGTPLWTQLEREGRIFTRDWELYDQQHVVMRPRRMSAWQLYWGTLLCYPRFYAGQNPWREARRVLGRWPLAVVAAVALAWPAMRHLSWAREIWANRAYIRRIRRLSAAR